MSWNAMTYDGKDTVFQSAVREQAEGFFTLVEDLGDPSSRHSMPGMGARDIVGNTADTTETYFEGFDAALRQADVEPASGWPVWHKAGKSRASRSGSYPSKRWLSDCARTSTR